MIAVSIQARLGSTRLPGKVLFPLGEQRVLGWVVHRARRIAKADEVVVAIGDAPENDAIIEWCKRRELNYVVGPEDDLLARHRAVADHTGADSLVRLTGDCPFVPTAEADRLLAEYRSSQDRYVTNFAEEMPVGTAVDIVDTELLDELAAEGETHPVTAIRDAPNTYNALISPNPLWADVADAHIAVDTPADYWLLTDAVETIGTEPPEVARWIADH